MQWKCLLLFCLAVLVKSASISKKDIPVKVVYDKEYHQKNYIRNLNEKVQLSAEELKQIESKPLESEVTYESKEQELRGLANELQIINDLVEKKNVKNIEEKIQLPSEILKQNQQQETSKTRDVYVNALRNHQEKIQLSSGELGEALKHLPLDDVDRISLRTLESDVVNNKNLYENVKEVVSKGIEDLKTNSKNLEQVINTEVWKKLDLEVKTFLEKINETHSLRQSNQNILEQFQQFTNNFLSQLTGQNNPQDENQSQPGFPQNIIGFFTNGFQQIQSGLSNLSGQSQSSTVQNDPDITTKAPGNNNSIQGIVSSVQGVFSQLNPFNQGQEQSSSSQGEESNQPNGPLQSIQNAFNQFGDTINNLNPFNQQTQKPGTSGDDTTTAGPLQFVQSIASQAGQVFNQLNPFQQSTTKAPAADPTKNPIQSAAENIGTQISEGISGIAGGNNPLQTAQGVVEQVGGALGGNNPLQGGNNPLQAAQGVVEQVGGALAGNNPLQGGNNPLQVAQSVAEQIAGGLTENSPLQGENNPLAAAQGVAEQVGGVIAGNNPLQDSGKPLQAVQGITEQDGEALTPNMPKESTENEKSMKEVNKTSSEKK